MPRRGLAVLALALPLTGCFGQTPSLHPLFTDTATVPVAGEWASDDGDPLTFERQGDHYEADFRDKSCKEDDCAIQLDVRFGRLSGRLFADFVQHDGNDAIGSWPVHAFARVELGNDRLEFSVLDRKWMAHALEQNLLPLKHEIVGGEIVLTAPTSDLFRVLTEWSSHPDAFGPAITFLRPLS
jgi:hypothetical protein